MMTGRQPVRRMLQVIVCLGLFGCSAGAPAPGPPASGPSRAPSSQAVSPSAPQQGGTLLVSPVPPAELATAGPVEAPGVVEIAAGGAEVADSPGGRAVGRLRAGILVPVSALQSGWAKILTPCEFSRWVPVTSLMKVAPSQVVLDPGHGGRETGAVGPSGLQEKTVNLAIAQKATELLTARGITSVLTRTDDYRATLPFRVELADAARAAMLISIHHNAEPDGKMDRPGTETYYQIGSQDSKRLAGLMYEEAIRVLSPLDADWVGDRDAGAKWRPNSRGGDYYGILRRSRERGLKAILAEFAFISNPTEEALLARPEVQNREAEAVAQAVTRYLRSRDPGSGFTTPYPREEPAGPGGGRSGCTDPA